MAVTKSEPAAPPQPSIGVPAVAVVSGSFLSGAMISLSAFVVPVFLDTNTDAGHMLRQWTRLYHYGHIYLPALCVATCGLYGYAALRKRAASSYSPQWSRYATAAAATLAMVPFTWYVMMPTNDILFGLEAAATAGTGSPELVAVRALVIKWAWLHVTRSLSPLVGAFLGFTSLLRELGL
ncbi:hypothetical protein B0T26DRAFT_671296 [Lasiosphaeria miniovina]|uniref:Uncharacterized protein n=1 Tax=Lasiosphaeria miniovina TaxID=1954250 RepID=A0AA40BIZ7_9PEZI|nr:uncharacterized protein B0T26DRAFT_671296 [Lasiosphaeria miniovina]KAK0735105.1 hypothetical protein B0T26DRAFT_671296 [Lasiosphaeria miniovina]